MGPDPADFLPFAPKVAKVATFERVKLKPQMAEFTEKNCSKCGQQLRFPNNVGGVVMACPSCGNKFYSGFKFGDGRKSVRGGAMQSIFGMPNELIKRIFRKYFS